MDDAIRAFMTFLTVERRASPETIRNYRSDLRQLTTFLLQSQPIPQTQRSLPIGDVTAESLRAYLHWLDRKGEQASSLARKLACLRSFYRFHIREGTVATNPAEGIRSPKLPKTLPRVLTKDDANVLMEFPEGRTSLPLRDRAILETLYSTGARVSEGVGLNLGDLNQSDGLVHLRGKGRKERIVPIGEVALQAIRTYRASLKRATGDCHTCVTPASRPRLEFDETGECNACVWHQRKLTEIDWVSRRRELEAICDKHRRSSYWDCIVPALGVKMGAMWLIG